jgi:hypothetical protein
MTNWTQKWRATDLPYPDQQGQQYDTVVSEHEPLCKFNTSGRSLSIMRNQIGLIDQIVGSNIQMLICGIETSKFL